MKLSVTLLLVFLLASCSCATQESAPTSLIEDKSIAPSDTLASQTQQQNNIQATASNVPEEEISEECIFDQATQTDKFLKNVKELKGYKWNPAQKMATIVLQTGDTLLIYRGGCEEFILSAQFRLRNDKTDYSKWENVYQKTLWLAKALDGEFDYKELKKAIDTNQVSIETNEQTDVVSFSNEFLADNSYSITRTLMPGLQVITLSYTII